VFNNIGEAQHISLAVYLVIPAIYKVMSRFTSLKYAITVDIKQLHGEESFLRKC
jgi:hypothetical protein